MRGGACFWCGGERSWERRYDPCHDAACPDAGCVMARGHDRGAHEWTSIRDNARKALKLRESKRKG